MAQYNFQKSNPKRYVTVTEVRRILEKTFGVTKNIFLLDRKYVILTEDEFKSKLVKSSINSEFYVPEEHDCDDFAIELYNELKLYPVGFIILAQKDYQTLHAVNVFVDVDNDIARLVEPQTDKYLDFNDFLFVHLIVM